MPTDTPSPVKHAMPLGARRVFRLSFCVSLSLAIGYGMATPAPFLAPIFALVLGMKSATPMRPKALLGLLLVVTITLGVGLLLIPVLLNYPVSAILIVAAGLYFSAYLAVNAGKALVGTFLTMGITLISAAGTADFNLASTLIKGLACGIAIAVVCQWVVYPWFPEDVVADQIDDDLPVDSTQSNWIAIRSTLIVLPVYFVALVNPAMFLPIIMKAVSLGQQGSHMHARDAGRELLGSTFMGGCFAIIFWFMLDLVTTLWMFAGWMLIFSVLFISRAYGIFASKYPPTFWVSVVVTMLILLGPAVEDSAGGKDVYAAFAVRMGLFIAVTLYACAAVYVLELLRYHHLRRRAEEMVLTN